MNNFKPGDRVRLIDNEDNRRHLDTKYNREIGVGGVYVVEDVDYDSVTGPEYTILNLVGIKEGFFAKRFEPFPAVPVFLTGDRVRVTSGVMSAFNGREGTVTEVAADPSDCYPYEVLLEDGTSVPFAANELTIIPPPEPDHIVVLVDDGAYAPAETPRVIRSRDGAEKVAERMSEKYGGEFAVFARVA